MLNSNQFPNTLGFSQSPFTILAGDIGGTKIDLALFKMEFDNCQIIKDETYSSKTYNDFATVISNFVEDIPLPDGFSFSVAGPVRNGSVKMTNLNWEIDAKKISKQFNNLPVKIINDLEATAYGVMVLKDEELYSVYVGEKDPNGNLAVIAPGTGLGEAGLYRGKTNYHPFATEGGHGDFAVRSELDIELYRYLHKTFGHVSWERLVSGPGIVNIFMFLKEEKKMEVPAWFDKLLQQNDAPKAISSNVEKSMICKETMTLFFNYLAIEASHLVLKLKGTGGLFIGGGIIPNVLPLLQADVFLENFQNNGRMKYLMQQVPVKVILNPKTALLGAAYYGATVK